MSNFCLDTDRHEWPATAGHRPFNAVFAAWIAVPALGFVHHGPGGVR